MRFAVIPVSTRAVYIHCIRHNHPTVISPASSNYPVFNKNNDNTSQETQQSESQSEKHIGNDSSNDTSIETSPVQLHHSLTIPARKTPRFDDKLVDRAAKLWSSFENSETAWKKKLVKGVSVLLERIPYSESSLRSIPAQDSVLRKRAIKDGEHNKLVQEAINQLESEQPDNDNNNDTNSTNIKNSDSDDGMDSVKRVKFDTHLSYNDFEKVQEKVKSSASLSNSSPIYPHHIIEPISVYYPNQVISADQSYAAMRALALNGRSIHFKNMLICLFVIPFTAPVALLPVIPNIPGIYLAYRAWCNFKALQGAKHLQYLTNEDKIVINSDTSSATDSQEPSSSSSLSSGETAPQESSSEPEPLIKGHLIFRPSEALNRVYQHNSDSISSGRTVYKYEGSSDPKTLMEQQREFEQAVDNAKKQTSSSNASETSKANDNGFSVGKDGKPLSDILFLTEKMVPEIENLVEHTEEKSDLQSQLIKAVHQTRRKIEKLQHK